jgi:Tfp pilus assembly protein PilF
MESAPACPTCGGPLTVAGCLRCENQSSYRFVHRELVILAVLVGIAVAAFFVTHRFAASNQALRHQDGRAWYSSGERALQRGDLATALAALRRATSKDPDNPTYRLALAHALMTGQQDDAARQLLLQLREQQPEDPETNLQLARLEARRGDRAAVGRYYETAIVGLWDAGQRATQRRVRTEFIEFLLEHGERDRALSELLVLDVSLPQDGASQLAAGRMLLAAGDPRRSADHFLRVLRANSRDQPALAGAVEAFFELRDYARVRQYLSDLAQDTGRTRELRMLTNLVFASDPLAPRLPMSERRRRLAAGLAQVIRRLETCDARTPRDPMNAAGDVKFLRAEAHAVDAALTARGKPRSSDEVEAGFEVIVRGERLANRVCGLPEPLDQALLLIAGRHGLEER